MPFLELLFHADLRQPILFLAFYMTYKWFHLSRIWNLGNSHRLISTCILSAPIWGLGRSSVLLLPSGGHSPFVIVLDTWDRLVLWKMPLTLLFLCSAMSSCLDILYSSSRILHALAINSQPWPEWDWCQMFRRRLQRTTRRGVPVTAVCVTWLLGFLFCVVSWRKGGGSTMTG